MPLGCLEQTGKGPPLSTPEVILVSLWNIPGIVLALFGNILVLYGSFRYNALNMGKVTLVLIQALTVMDLLLVVCKWIPDAVTPITQCWVLGSAICFISGRLSHGIAIIEFSLIATISLYKLYILVKPIQRVASPRYAQRYVMGLVLLCLVYRLAPMALGSRSVYLEDMLTCEPNDLIEWHIFSYITNVVFLALPIILTMAANIGIMAVAWRNSTRWSGKSLPSRNAVITVSAISWLFTLSVAPIMIRVFLVTLSLHPPGWYMLLQKELFYMNVVLNPICYTVTNRRFKHYFFINVLHLASSRFQEANKTGTVQELESRVHLKGVKKVLPRVQNNSVTREQGYSTTQGQGDSLTRDLDSSVPVGKSAHELMV